MKTEKHQMNASVVKIAVAAAALVFAISCSGPSDGRETSHPEDSEKSPLAKETKSVLETKNVKIQTIELGSLTESALAHGVTMADHHVIYSAEVPGKIEYLKFDLGDEVKKGQTLARIDFQTLKAQAEQAQSNYDLASATYERISKLKGDGVISQQQYDEAYSASVSAKAQLEIAKANVSKSIIKANHYGIVSAKYVEKSEYVGPGARLYEVVDYRNIIVEAQLAESQVAAVSVGSNVEVDISALDQSFTGTVDTIIPTADAVSKTFRARVKIENPNLKILVGMSARLKIKAKTYENVLIAPQNAILEEQGGTRSIFVTNGDAAEKRLVHLGPHQGGDVVVEEGLNPGEQIIVVGQRDLLDGQPIHIIQ